MSKALIVVDMQKDFIDGSLGTEEAQNIVENVYNKIKSYSDVNNLIVFTQDTHYENYLETQEGKNLPVKHCIYDTPGWRFGDGVIPGTLDGQVQFIQKETFGFIDWSSIADFSKFESIELIGLCTDICVVSNALILKALYPEVSMFVDASCCAGVTPEKHLTALETMKSCQINVINE